MAKAGIRVVIADDQPLFASGLAMLIEAQPDMQCVGTPSDGREAIELVARERPDIVLMDLRMPELNGIDATQSILAGHAADEPPRVVVLTTIRKDEAVLHAMAVGASGFLTKDATPEDVLGTIRAVHAGTEIPAAALAVANETPLTSATSRREETLSALSPREREVFLLLARGLSNAEIAEASWVTEATVKTQTRSILQKLDLRSRVQVVVFAYENGLVSG